MIMGGKNIYITTKGNTNRVYCKNVSLAFNFYLLIAQKLLVSINYRHLLLKEEDAPIVDVNLSRSHATRIELKHSFKSKFTQK